MGRFDVRDEIEDVKIRLTKIESILEEWNTNHLHDIKNLGKRPSWAVSLIITLLSSLVVGMSIALIK